MKKTNKYYSLMVDKNEKIANINIFGDITSYPWRESDVTNYNLSKRLEELKDMKKINVYINSYGGEVAEGWAIYNALKNHNAEITTIVNGFACSIASVIFMAGKKRIMNETSCLMIHNVLTYVAGNANQLRKEADDLDKLNNLSKKAYLNYVNIDEQKLADMMDKETFLSPNECLEMGFATEIVEEKSSKISQSAKKNIMNKIFNNLDEDTINETNETNDSESTKIVQYECSECGYIYEGELPEYFICPECGASKDSFIEIEVDEESDEDNDIDEETSSENSEEENANQKAFHFFNVISKK